ncbi:MAG TPA: DUF4136 domain-containing protein [Pyrinomonadaceae bacterium]|nr:DUF4136 domain-containing protein [Pyrinomonadaceae bacterium]
MKPIRALLSCGLFLFLCAAGAMAQSVQTDYDHNFNLAKLRGFAFAKQERGPRDPLAASPINDRRIHDALDTQLKANGYYADELPDFEISYFVTTRKGYDIQDNRMGLLQRWGGVNVSQVTEGTIVVVFTDSKSNQEVWRGYINGTINPNDLDKDVNKGVTKLIQKFKKNQAGQK